MKRAITFLLGFVCVLVILAGTALAGSAPTAMSYFTDPDYNKTYTADDGLQHTMSVKWVGETWNKVGTVIYSINYEDVYQKDGDTYIDVKSTMETFKDARPTYPDSPKYSVYQVKWYPDGHTEVVSDYRPAETPAPAPESTQAPAISPPASSTAAATKAPIAKPTSKPTRKPTAKPTAVPTATPAPAVTPTPTEALTAMPSPTPEATPTPTPSPSPSVMASLAPAVSVAPTSAEPEVTDLPAQSGSIQSMPKAMWGWIVFPVLGICAAFLILRSWKNRKGNTKP